MGANIILVRSSIGVNNVSDMTSIFYSTTTGSLGVFKLKYKCLAHYRQKHSFYRPETTYIYTTEIFDESRNIPIIVLKIFMLTVMIFRIFELCPAFDHW